MNYFNQSVNIGRDCEELILKYVVNVNHNKCMDEMKHTYHYYIKKIVDQEFTHIESRRYNKITGEYAKYVNDSSNFVFYFSIGHYAGNINANDNKLMVSNSARMGTTFLP